MDCEDFRTEKIIQETIRAAFGFAKEASLSQRDFAKWLCTWFQNLSPKWLIQCLCLNTKARHEAEANLVAFVNKHTGLVIATKRIARQNGMSRNTHWPKTLDKASGLPMPMAYYNRISRQTPNRFLYGALRWLASTWRDELERFKRWINDADARLEALKELESIPVIAQSPPLPFCIRNLMQLHEMGAKGDVEASKFVESWQELNQLECQAVEEDPDKEYLVNTICQKCQVKGGDNKKRKQKKKRRLNNLFELLVILKSAAALQNAGGQKDGWKMVRPESDFDTSKPIKPIIQFERPGTGFRCTIAKGGVGKCDLLSKSYRFEHASGFEPDVAYIFHREATGHHDAVLFLGDAKNYSVSNHDVAVRDKLLNVFAFARALGLRLHGYGDDGKLVDWHSDGNEPIPSFMLFFPTFEDNSERAFRNVMERFSLDCFECNNSHNPQACKQNQEKCPGNVAESFVRIFELIRKPEFDWPLCMTEKGELELKQPVTASSDGEK